MFGLIVGSFRGDGVGAGEAEVLVWVFCGIVWMRMESCEIVHRFKVL